MCTLCSAEAVNYGSPLPGWYLIQARRDDLAEPPFMRKGEWGLVRKNDPEFIWGVTPLPYPKEEEDFTEYMRALDSFYAALVGTPDSCLALIEAAKQVGWEHEPGKSFASWLFPRLGKLVKEHGGVL